MDLVTKILIFLALLNAGLTIIMRILEWRNK